MNEQVVEMIWLYTNHRPEEEKLRLIVEIYDLLFNTGVWPGIRRSTTACKSAHK